MRIPSCYTDGYDAARKMDRDAADAYIRHTTFGDPAADAAVADLAGAVKEGQEHRLIAAALRNHRDPPPATPESLRRLIVDAAVVPDWYSREIATVAARAFLRNSDIAMAALSTAAIVEGFTTLISKSFRIRSRLINNGVRRLKQNLLQLMEQYIPGGVEPGGDAWRLSLRIRLVHAQSRALIRTSEDWDEPTYGTPLSASHMLLGAAAFSARLLHHVERLGGSFTDEEREAYVHVWRYTALTMGVPNSILFEDMASALHSFNIATTCEPPPDEDSIILSNSIINSTPIILGHTERSRRRKHAAHYYQMSRELIGDELADVLKFPEAKRFRIVPIIRLQNRFLRRASKLVRPLRYRVSVGRFSQLLFVTDLGDLGHSYNLPDTVIDEESKEW